MASPSPLTIYFLPLPSPGHLLPMLDIANLFAASGADAAVILTSSSAAAATHVAFRHLILPFPSSPSLPAGVESADALPSRALSSTFATALSLLYRPFYDLISSNPPDALVYDICLPWAAAAARELNIPTFAFPGTGCFANSVDLSIYIHRPTFNGSDDDQPFIVPGLPDKTILTKKKLRETVLPGADVDEFFDKAREAEKQIDGYIVNSFDEMERRYVETYSQITGKPVWTVGPVVLANPSPSLRGGSPAAATEIDIPAWLDTKIHRSVLYVCFGSLSLLPLDQVKEIGLGLEKSDVNFIWVVGNVAGESSEVVEDWLENLKTRVTGRGLVVSKGKRVAQMGVLMHPAVGGFLSHCGWGSAVEAVTTGVPVLTWPMFGEQFYNERLLVDVLGVAAAIGAEEGFPWGMEETAKVVVGKEIVAEKTAWFMCSEGDKVKEMRKRAAELKNKARAAMAEGGSSYNNVGFVLEEIKRRRA